MKILPIPWTQNCSSSKL